MKDEIIDLLRLEDKEKVSFLFDKALKTKLDNIGNKVYLRGLIEYSNICQKKCFYCGLRAENKINRYALTNEEVVNAAIFAHKNNFASIVIQAGEVKSHSYTKKITRLLDEINENTNGELGITLSLGEQTKDTLKEWKDTGKAIRYLLRIETSNQELFNKIHPNDTFHSFDKRLATLDMLKDLGYQVGTGIMIGLPFQTEENLASDLVFFMEKDIDMVGMGPYIEHKDTPLYRKYKKILLPLQKRLELTLKMIAILRTIMPTINIAATTALQTIDNKGREMAIQAGANIVMPNISPVKHRKDYLLYENKVCLQDEADKCMSCIFNRIHSSGAEIGWGEQGNSLHFLHSNIL